MNWMLLLSMALLALLALTLIVVLGLRQRAEQRTRLDVNRELYEQRKQELAQEYADGLLSDKALSAAERELDKRFVSENAELEKLEEHAIGKGILWPAVLIIGLAVVGYALFGSWEQQRHADKARQALPELAQEVLNNQQAAPSQEDLELFALGLRQRLYEDGGDGLTWMLYARTATALQRYEQALEAYQHAYKLDPTRSGILLGYAQLLINLGGAEELRQAAQLLSKLMQQEPQNIDALSLTGAVAYQRGDWQQAVQAWQLLLQVMGEDDPRYAAVSEALTDAKAQLSGTQQQLQVTVELAQSLRNQVPEGATLFVFVKAPEGPGMPAAVVRQPIESFPVTVLLSDAQAMLPDYKMSQLQQWQVEARVSADERIEIATGDLGALPQVVPATGDAQVTLIVDKVLVE